MFLYILFIISLTFLLYESTDIIYKIPDVKVEKKIKRLQRRNKNSQKAEIENALIVRICVPLLVFVFTKIKGLRYNEFKLRADIEKVGIKESVEVFLATGILYSFVSMIVCGVLWMMTNTMIFLGLGLLFGMLMPFYPKSSLRGKVRKLNDELLKEFPNFVSTMRYQYGKGKTLNDIVQSYIDVAGPALRYELQRLSAELEMMADSDALLRFGDRVALPEVSNFASSLVYGQMYGMDLNSIFAIQEQEMRRLTRDNIMKLMRRKPILMTILLMLPIGNIILIIGVPPIISMITAMSML